MPCTPCLHVTPWLAFYFIPSQCSCTPKRVPFRSPGRNPGFMFAGPHLVTKKSEKKTSDFFAQLCLNAPVYSMAPGVSPLAVEFNPFRVVDPSSSFYHHCFLTTLSPFFNMGNV